MEFTKEDIKPFVGGVILGFLCGIIAFSLGAPQIVTFIMLFLGGYSGVTFVYFWSSSASSASAKRTRRRAGGGALPD